MQAFLVACEGVLYWRHIGQGKFCEIPLEHVSRGVYRMSIPSDAIDDKYIEYYVRVTLEGGQELYYPASAPKINKTVIARP